MGFLRRLFGAKKPGPPTDGSATKSDKDSNKRRWTFAKQSSRRKSLPPPPPQPPPPSAFTQFDPSTSLERNKHAIAVAAATAAVAEAALATAHAAAEVVRLTSNGAGSSSKARGASQPRLPEDTAAVRIQSAFRGYLARRALRALKALVKLQALVRGHIVRKQSADMLRRMQTLVRLQTQARATRAHHLSSDNLHSFKSSLSHYPVPEEYEDPHSHRVCSTKFGGSSILKRCSSNANFKKIESERQRIGSNWLDHWMQDNSDTWKPHESPLKHSTKPQNQTPSFKFHKGKDQETASRTADNSPQTFSASLKTGNSVRRGNPFTPTRSECSWSFLGGYSGYPNFMANTESSRAKVRSQSAPRQRHEFEGYISSRRPFQGLWEVGSTNSDQDSDSRSNRVSPSLSRFNRTGSNNLR
ncbi:unnamed protein product [Vicia faba]|uniref:DUF4005 domain-containing protein n=1 Tax=Vicia faba TaxID=3906 RepID=A0AAV1A3G0_VICFA|nr:unnamed protein product [Vicia faba]